MEVWTELADLAQRNRDIKALFAHRTLAQMATQAAADEVTE